MTYLYLLPFKDGVHFKLGISKSLDDRISKHADNFDLDPDKALFVTAKHSAFIISLEQELLMLLDDPKYSKYCDGYTEIRLTNDFEKVLSYINLKNDFLGFKIEKYNNLKVKIRRPKISKEDLLIKEERLKYIDRLKQIRIDLDINPKCTADGLEITQMDYKKIEKYGCDNDIKTKLIIFLISKCVNTNQEEDYRYELKKELYNMLNFC